MSDTAEGVDNSSIAFLLPENRAVYALRAFFRTASGRLAGIEETWAAARQEAGCEQGHLAPYLGCACGFGLCDDVAELDSCEYLRDSNAPVIALVRAWGRMVIDEPQFGAIFRAQHCEIVALTAVEPVDPDEVPSNVPAVEAVALAYKVPLMTETQMVEAHSRKPTLEALRRSHVGGVSL